MLKDFVTKALIYPIENPAPFLRWSAAGVYTISALVQAIGIATNEKIPEKEKSFLIPQELLTGSLQLGTFLTVATALEKLGEKLALSGKILPNKMANGGPAFVKGISVAFSIIGTVLSFNLITPLLRNPIAYLLQKKTNNTNLSNESQFLARPIIPASNFGLAYRGEHTGPFTQFNGINRTNRLPQKAYNIPFTSTGLKL